MSCAICTIIGALAGVAISSALIYYHVARGNKLVIENSDFLEVLSFSKHIALNMFAATSESIIIHSYEDMLLQLGKSTDNMFMTVRQVEGNKQSCVVIQLKYCHDASLSIQVFQSEPTWKISEYLSSMVREASNKFGNRVRVNKWTDNNLSGADANYPKIRAIEFIGCLLRNESLHNSELFKSCNINNITEL